MDFADLIPIMGILLVMIPVAGITFALTLRFAVRPFVETLSTAVRDAGGLGSRDREEMLALMQSVEALRDEVTRLREAQSFDRELLGAPAEAATAPTADPDGQR